MQIQGDSILFYVRGIEPANEEDEKRARPDWMTPAEAGAKIEIDAGEQHDGAPRTGVRAGVWDRFATMGEKIKEGRRSVFDKNTLGQMVRNFRARGDQLSMCANHQSAYVAQNGQPAPALAFYDALAVVLDGEAVTVEALPGSIATPDDLAGRPDGLYGFRCQVTDVGQQLLPGFKYISPMFVDDGRDERGNQIGYALLDVAATNTPFQAGCEITFEKAAPAAGGPTQMSYLQRLIDDELERQLGRSEPHHATTFAAGTPRPPHMAQRRIYENALATFVVDDEEIAAIIRQYADATSGPMKMEIDAMLSEDERSQPDCRWIAADRLVRTRKHPELWEATKRAQLF